MISGTDSLEACVKGAKYIQVLTDKDMEMFLNFSSTNRSVCLSHLSSRRKFGEALMSWWMTRQSWQARHHALVTYIFALTLRARLMSPLSPVPSKISDFMKHRAQFIVAHPCNPPYHTPMVELVPAPWTSEEVRAGTRSLMQEVGQGPVSLSRELPGFVLNRYSSSQSGALGM